MPTYVCRSSKSHCASQASDVGTVEEGKVRSSECMRAHKHASAHIGVHATAQVHRDAHASTPDQNKNKEACFYLL
jgi:hypothetical protein